MEKDKLSYIRDYSIIVLNVTVLFIDLALFNFWKGLLITALLGALPTVWNALRAISRRRITIDVLNSVALVVSFTTFEIKSAVFIVLMLTSARLLCAYTERSKKNAIEALLRLKPSTALREKDGKLIKVPTDTIRENDILVVNNGSRIPVDGVVIFGKALVNESSVTGETALVEKFVGDSVLSSTLNESGVIKIRATKVGSDSTVERMVALIREAAKHKSHAENLADRFAQIFLPIIGVAGLVTYLVTHNIVMTAALFLVTCADDMAVAIPLAVVATLGNAAKRGVIIKGGELLDILGRMKTLIFDKTGTLTYGNLSVRDVHIEPWVKTEQFWYLVAIAEKFSEHPMGRTVFREAIIHSPDVPDADEFKVYKGHGVWARHASDEVVIGNESIFAELGIPLADEIKQKIEKEKEEHQWSTFPVVINRRLAGLITIADMPRSEAKSTINELRQLGVRRILMFTGDNAVVAKNVAKTLGISEFRAGMLPEEKFRELEKLIGIEPVGMVGDGINDAPALARADVGIAMGISGTAVTVEAADVVILTDELNRLPELILLGRKTTSVIRTNMIIWLLTNVIGFGLVLTGIFGPTLAAFYNFATDFLPLFNSARLFSKKVI